LPATELSLTSRADATAPGRLIATVENTGKGLAFQVHLKLVDSSTGKELLPVFWDDNYFALMPGEKREIAVSSPLTASSSALTIEADAWNSPRITHSVSGAVR
jgi:exo-1,4-beta-D-glucosaminidase